ncbi:MAG: RNA polymerase sigma factor [Sandaracinaceae bacterium]
MIALALDPESALIRLSPLSSSDAERAQVRAIAERLQRRDTALMERILEELLPDLDRWMYYFMGGRSDREDATQEALTEICASLHRFEGRSSVATLARRIAWRVANRVRTKRRHEALEVEVADEAGEAEAALDAKRALATLLRHLEELPEDQRAVLILCGLEGLSPSEAAEVLSVSANLARVRLHRARAALASRLGARGNRR